MENILAVFDSDNSYAMRFMDYVKKRNEVGFEITVFTNMDSLEEFIKNHAIEIVLFSDIQFLEKFPKEGIKYKFHLTDPKEASHNTEVPIINKYQPAREVLSEVLTCYTRLENEAEVVGSGETSIITIMSFLPDSSKITFAWSMATTLSEKKKVLLIPLELLPIPFLSETDDSNQSLSEFIYYLKETNPNNNLKMKSLLHYIGKLSYLSGLTHGLDILSLNKEDIIRWIELIKLHNDYEAVVFYLSTYNEAAIELMNQSAIIYLATGDNPYEKALVKEWERQMKLLDIQTNQAKFKRIIVPEVELAYNGTVTIQEIQNDMIWQLGKQHASNL